MPEPVVTDEDVEKSCIEELRENKATYANEDPRPPAAGAFWAVVSLESLSGADEPIKSDEVQVEIGGKETMPGFTENLTGTTLEAMRRNSTSRTRMTTGARNWLLQKRFFSASR